MTKRINVSKLIHQAEETLTAKHNEEDLKKIGTLRGGSVGCVINTSKGKVITGTCPREAHARMLGYQGSHGLDKKVMFKLGIANEDIWNLWLDNCGYDGVIKREEELGLEWDIEGTKASGRPDIVLCDSEGNPKEGLELKMVASVWTARSVLLEHKPKMNHLIQAGNYSYRMGIPFQLWYTSYVNLAGPDFINNLIPKRGKPGSQWIDYTLGESYHSKDRSGKLKYNSKGNPVYNIRKLHVYSQDQDQTNDFLKHHYGVSAFQFKNIKPFIMGYLIEWRDGVLFWGPEGCSADAMIETPITQAGIDEYYQIVAQAGIKQQLPPRPIGYDAFGKKQKFNVDDYSKLQMLSDESNDNYNEWLKLLKQHPDFKGEK